MRSFRNALLLGAPITITILATVLVVQFVKISPANAQSQEEKLSPAFRMEMYLNECEGILAEELREAVSPFLSEHEHRHFARDMLVDCGRGFPDDAMCHMLDCEKRIRIAVRKQLVEERLKKGIKPDDTDWYSKKFYDELRLKLKPYQNLFDARQTFMDAHRDLTRPHFDHGIFVSYKASLDPVVAPLLERQEKDEKKKKT